MDYLKNFDLIYLATPYTKYPAGIEAAFEDAAALAGELLQYGLKVYSPITHTHPIAMHADIDPLDHTIWLPFDGAMMRKADAILVAKMLGWGGSLGIAHEIETFWNAGKPVYYLDPETLKVDNVADDPLLVALV